MKNSELMVFAMSISPRQQTIKFNEHSLIHDELKTKLRPNHKPSNKSTQHIDIKHRRPNLLGNTLSNNSLKNDENINSETQRKIINSISF